MLNRFINPFYLGVIFLLCLCISINTPKAEDEDPPKCNNILNFTKHKRKIEEKKRKVQEEVFYKFALLVVNAYLMESRWKSGVSGIRSGAYRSFFYRALYYFTPGEKAAYYMLRRGIVNDYELWLIRVVDYESRSVLAKIMKNNRSPKYDNLLMPPDALSVLNNLPFQLRLIKSSMKEKLSQTFDPESFMKKIEAICLMSKEDPLLYE